VRFSGDRRPWPKIDDQIRDTRCEIRDGCHQSVRTLHCAQRRVSYLVSRISYLLSYFESVNGPNISRRSCYIPWMPRFEVRAPFLPAGDQPRAIAELTAGLRRGDRYQTLLGVTGSGKTMTLAHTIAAHGRPTLVLSHNKTLAAQL